MVVLFALSMTLAIPVASAAPREELSGIATYRERTALPPNAEFVATLEDASRRDAPPVEIAHVRMNRLDQVPIEFTIRYDPRRVNRGGKYDVRATISERGHVRWNGVASYRMRGRGHEVVSIVMHRMREPYNPPPPSHTIAGLTDTRWRAVQIANRQISTGPREREPWMELDSHVQRVTGSGGCNRMSGSYEAGHGMLRFGPLISTKMACVSMETENAFFRALERTRGYRIQNRTLVLTDDMGRTLARLEEGTLR
jgi:putative lipoprotein